MPLVRIRMELFIAMTDRVHIALRRLERDAVLDTADHENEVSAPERGVAAEAEVGDHPEIGRLGSGVADRRRNHLKPVGDDADHRLRLPVDDDGTADDARIGTEASSPEPLAQNDRVG